MAPPVEQKYPFRNTLVKYKLPPRLFPQHTQIHDLALEGYGALELLNVLSLAYIRAHSLHAGLNELHAGNVQQVLQTLLHRHPHLNYLDLWGNPLRDSGVAELFFGRLKAAGMGGAAHPFPVTLRVLNLNQVGVTMSGFGNVVRYFAGQTGSRLAGIRCLSLANNSLTLNEEGLLALQVASLKSSYHSSSPTSRSSHSRLAKLNVFPDGYQLASGFSGVLALDLSDCGLGVQAATPLADFLKSTLTLRVFGLSFNELGGSGMRKILAAVLSQLSGLVPADVLKGDFVIRNAPATRSAGRLVRHNGAKGLARLLMRGNGALDRKGLAVLFQVLEAISPSVAQYHRLEYLDLRLNIVDQLLWLKFENMMADSRPDFHELRHILKDVNCELAGGSCANGAYHKIITGNVHDLSLGGNFVLRPPTEYYVGHDVGNNTLLSKDVEGHLNVCELFAEEARIRLSAEAAGEELEHGPLQIAWAGSRPQSPDGKTVSNILVKGAAGTKEDVNKDSLKDLYQNSGGAVGSSRPDSAVSGVLLKEPTSGATGQRGRRGSDCSDHADMVRPLRVQSIDNKQVRAKLSATGPNCNAELAQFGPRPLSASSLSPSTWSARGGAGGFVDSSGPRVLVTAGGRPRQAARGGAGGGGSASAQTDDEQARGGARGGGAVVVGAGGPGGPSSQEGRSLLGAYTDDDGLLKERGAFDGNAANTPAGGGGDQTYYRPPLQPGRSMSATGMRPPRPDNKPGTGRPASSRSGPSVEHGPSLHRSNTMPTAGTTSSGTFHPPHPSVNSYLMSSTEQSSSTQQILQRPMSRQRGQEYRKRIRRRQELQSEFGNLAEWSLVGRPARAAVLDPTLKNDKVFFQGDAEYPIKRNVRNEVVEWECFVCDCEKAGWNLLQ